MITVKDKSTCCGCGACAQKCPVGAISMQADEEGFLYPVGDHNTCISCGLCEKVCPILNRRPEIRTSQDGYICQLRNRNMLGESTSGGAFSAIASYVLNRNGVVFGAVMNEDFSVSHSKIDSPEGLAKMRGSKYVQSEIGQCFIDAQTALKEGKYVLFSGTPCQIEGLLNYVGDNLPNLLTADVVCHAVPSPKIWRIYTEYRKENKSEPVTSYRFRDKSPYGYQLSVLSAYHDEKQTYHGDISTDPFLRAFFSNICDRPSCYDCQFKKRYRRSDFTLWDCLDIGQFSSIPVGMEPRLGVSSVLVHSEKGKRVWSEIQDQLILSHVDADKLAASSKEMMESVQGNEKRDAFFRDADTLSPDVLFSTYFPTTAKKRAEHAIRIVLVRLGLTSKVRTAAKKIIKEIKR